MTDVPKMRDGVTHHFVIRGEQSVDGFLTINTWNGEVREVFIVVSKQGGAIRGMVDSLAIMISNALQYGMPLFKVCKALHGITYEPKGMTDDPEVPWCTSITDYIARRLALHLSADELTALGLVREPRVNVPLEDVCPSPACYGEGNVCYLHTDLEESEK